MQHNKPLDYDVSNYFSPELHFAFLNKNVLSIEDIQKSDIFSFGLILLEMSSLESLENLYNGFSVNKNKLEEILERV